MDYVNQQTDTDTVIAALNNNPQGTTNLPGLLGEIPQEQRQPLNGADMVNRAIDKGLHLTPDLDDEQFRQNVANAPTINNPQVLNLINMLDGNKQLYAGAQEVLNLYGGKNPDELTDEDRNKINLAQNVMQAAQSGNEYIRRMAQDGGVELGLWGGTDRLTPAQSAYASGVNQIRLNRELEDSLVGKYGLNSDQFFERAYDDYRRNGEGHERATILAGRDASKYQADRMAFLDSTMNNFGITDGRFNQLGSRLKGMLAEEDAIRASVYNNDFATPKDEYNYQNKVAMADLAHALGLEDKQIAAMLQGQLQAQRDAAAWEREFFKQQQANNRNDKDNYVRMLTSGGKGGNGGGRSGNGKENKPTAKQAQVINMYNNALANLSKRKPENPEDMKPEDVQAYITEAESDIAALEDWLKKEGTSLDPDSYDVARYYPYIVRGQMYKMLNDDEDAYKTWVKVPADLLDQLIGENVDGIREWQEKHGVG